MATGKMLGIFLKALAEDHYANGSTLFAERIEPMGDSLLEENSNLTDEEVKDIAHQVAEHMDDI